MLIAPGHGLTRDEQPTSLHESSEAAVAEEEEPEVGPHGSPRCRSHGLGRSHLGLRQDHGPLQHWWSCDLILGSSINR